MTAPLSVMDDAVLYSGFHTIPIAAYLDLLHVEEYM